MKRALGAVAATAVAIALMAAGVAQAAVAPLTGETLTGFGSSTTTQCSGINPRSSYTNTYDSSGTATGPYPGTYTEQGSVTVKNGRVTAFAASFTIVSGTTTVTGTKTLSGGGSGVCGLTGTVTWNNTAVYTATIQTPAETGTDSGESTVQGFSGGTITETFVSAPCDPNSQGDQNQNGNGC